MIAQAELSEPTMDDSNVFEQDTMNGDDTGAEESVENQVSEQEDSIIDETLPVDVTLVRDRTRSKSKKFVILQAVSPSDSEDNTPGPRNAVGELDEDPALYAQVPTQILHWQQELESISKHCQQEANCPKGTGWQPWVQVIHTRLCAGVELYTAAASVSFLEPGFP